jgi:hypothetical protein
MSIMVYVLLFDRVSNIKVQLLRTAPILSQLRTHPTLGCLDLYCAGRQLLPLDICAGLGLSEGSILEALLPFGVPAASTEQESARVFSWADEVMPVTASIAIPTRAVGEIVGRHTHL